MRILLCSNWFAPSIGGVETVSKILAEEFTKAGHLVTLVTRSSGPTDSVMGVPYTIVRRPSQAMLWKLASQSDALMQNLISLRTLLPLLTTRKTVVLTHQYWLSRSDGSRGPIDRAKLSLLPFCRNLSISRAIADSLPVQSEVIGNPFEPKEFQRTSQTDRNKDIIFMGRLLFDKGCQLLLEALLELKNRGLTPTVTIIGDGPEMQRLRQFVQQFSLESQLEFKGAMREGRGEVVAQHRIMVVPSIWAEPFGVVALEGIASGCAIIASSQGGLPEAVGPCGLYFPKSDVHALAARLEELLLNDALHERLVAAGPDHLMRFHPTTIAARYLSIFGELVS